MMNSCQRQFRSETGHEISFARDVSSRVVFLHKGQIEMQGKPAEVFRRGQSERFDQFLANTAH